MKLEKESSNVDVQNTQQKTRIPSEIEVTLLDHIVRNKINPPSPLQINNCIELFVCKVETDIKELKCTWCLSNLNYAQKEL